MEEEIATLKRRIEYLEHILIEKGLLDDVDLTGSSGGWHPSGAFQDQTGRWHRSGSWQDPSGRWHPSGWWQDDTGRWHPPGWFQG